MAAGPDPRLLTKAEAAAYCNVKPTTFGAWVVAGRLPPAVPGTHRWDRKAIDAALDKLSGITPQETLSAYDQWKAGQDARAS